VTPARKLPVTVAMFAIAAALVFVASATDSSAPLFAAFIPLLVVPWVLTRPEPGAPPDGEVEPTDSPSTEPEP
jgi:hypothetical protein